MAFLAHQHLKSGKFYRLVDNHFAESISINGVEHFRCLQINESFFVLEILRPYHIPYDINNEIEVLYCIKIMTKDVIGFIGHLDRSNYIIKIFEEVT